MDESLLEFEDMFAVSWDVSVVGFLSEVVIMPFVLSITIKDANLKSEKQENYSYEK